MASRSKQKGNRAEYLLRDTLRRQGYEADRVPLSGASQGFKGDLRVSKEGVEYTIEVKSRKDQFKKIYSLYEKHKRLTGLHVFQFHLEGELISVSDSMDLALQDAGTYENASGLVIRADYRPYVRTLSKILNMKKLVQDCNVLAIKDDRCSFLFLRYRSL